MALTTTSYVHTLTALPTGYDTRIPDASHLLAAGHSPPTNLAMALVYPKADSVTPAWAYHRRTYPGAVYDVPVGVRHGRLPYIFKLVAGPSGMTVGEKITDSNYGRVRWSNPTTGTHNVMVRVIDQDLNVVTVRWALEVTTSGAIFIDPVSGDDGTGTGAIGAPFQTTAPIVGVDASDATYAGYQIYFRAGTHTLVGGAWSSNNYRFGVNKALVWRAYNEEAVTISCGSANMTWQSIAEDLAMHGLTFSGNRADVNNSKFIAANSQAKRMLLSNVTFVNHVNGLVNSDNPNCVFFSELGGSTRHNDIYFADVYATGTCSGLVDTYTMDGVLFERCKAYDVVGNSQPSTHGQLFYFKSKCANMDIRYNEAWDNITSVPATSGMIGTGILGANSNMEFRYNKVSSETDGTDYAIRWGVENGTESNVWFQRNTIKGRFAGASGSTTETNCHFGYNVHLSGTAVSSRFDKTYQTASYAYDAAVLDANHNLQGTYRDALLGVHGAEVA